MGMTSVQGHDGFHPIIRAPSKQAEITTDSNNQQQQSIPYNHSDVFTSISSDFVLRSHDATPPKSKPRFHLHIRQTARHGLASGEDESGCRNNKLTPLDPPTICELVPETSYDTQFLSVVEAMLHCTLVEADAPHPPVVASTSRKGELLMGSRVESAFVAPCTQAWDLSVRRAGQYRLRFDLIERSGLQLQRRTSVYGEAFNVVSDKQDFHGFSPSTDLLLAIARRGLKLRVVKAAGQDRKGDAVSKFVKRRKYTSSTSSSADPIERRRSYDHDGYRQQFDYYSSSTDDSFGASHLSHYRPQIGEPSSRPGLFSTVGTLRSPPHRSYNGRITSDTPEHYPPSTSFNSTSRPHNISHRIHSSYGPGIRSRSVRPSFQSSFSATPHEADYWREKGHARTDSETILPPTLPLAYQRGWPDRQPSLHSNYRSSEHYQSQDRQHLPQAQSFYGGDEIDQPFFDERRRLPPLESHSSASFHRILNHERSPARTVSPTRHTRRLYYIGGDVVSNQDLGEQQEGRVSRTLPPLDFPRRSGHDQKEFLEEPGSDRPSAMHATRYEEKGRRYEVSPYGGSHQQTDGDRINEVQHLTRTTTPIRAFTTKDRMNNEADPRGSLRDIKSQKLWQRYPS